MSSLKGGAGSLANFSMRASNKRSELLSFVGFFPTLFGPLICHQGRAAWLGSRVMQTPPWVCCTADLHTMSSARRKGCHVPRDHDHILVIAIADYLLLEMNLLGLGLEGPCVNAGMFWSALLGISLSQVALRLKGAEWMVWRFAVLPKKPFQTAKGRLK